MKLHAALMACGLAALWPVAVQADDIETRLSNLEARLNPAQAGSASSGAFNPDISLILQGRYVDSKDVDDRHISGFIPAGGLDDGDGHGHGEAGRGFSLDHSELVLSANIDTYLYGYATLALLGEDVELEEAWFQTLGLGHGLTLKAGRFYSNLGYQNEQHPHYWDFADNALMYQALFGGSYSNDGLQLKWLAPFSDMFVELSGEIGKGANFPGSELDKTGSNVGILGLHLGGDVGASNSWRGGVSWLNTRAYHREFAGHDPGDVEITGEFNGKSKTWIADFVWKWAPHGNPTQRNFTFQAEYFLRKEDGALECVGGVGSICDPAVDGDYYSRQSGWYAQAVYQFMPRWRTGYRYDRLNRGTVSFDGVDIGATFVELAAYNPERHSVMLDYSPSEFSRFRLQYARDQAMQGVTDNQLTLQYMLSLGAHGAHKF